MNDKSSNYEEYFEKKGTKSKLWHLKLVRVTLEDNHLKIWKNKNSVKHDIEIIPETVIGYKDNKDKLAFSIQNPNEELIELKSKNEAITKRWVTLLRTIVYKNNQYTINDFDIISVIGKGYYGKVMLCREKKTHKIYAIKSVHKARLIKSDKIMTIYAERNSLLKVKHPFIVQIRFAFQTDTKFYLGLEYVPGGELFKHLADSNRLPLDEIRLYIAEVSLALDYLHSLHIVYRDLKPENILLDLQGHVKLTDFGLVKNLSAKSSTTTFCGTSEYLAPEIINEEPYDEMIDWWELGIMTYELAFGDTPFAHKNKAKTYDEICTKDPWFPSDFDPDCKDFIMRLLKKKPSERMKFPEIKNHPFFKGMNFDDIYQKKYKPAYVPPQPLNSCSLVNFDSEFTGMKPQDSVATPVDASFNGFSFIASRYKDTEPPEAHLDKNVDELKKHIQPKPKLHKKIDPNVWNDKMDSSSDDSSDDSSDSDNSSESDSDEDSGNFNNFDYDVQNEKNNFVPPNNDTKMPFYNVHQSSKSSIH